MSEVKRYRCTVFGGMVPRAKRDGGNWIHADDFERVKAERDALQERLNAADQRDDDLSFQLNDREGSRRDWFEAAQAAEKRVEELEGLLRRVVDSGRFSFEQDAPEELEAIEVDIIAVLSASAEPKKCRDGGMCGDSSHKCSGCAPVERDERAECAICRDLGDQCLECEEAEFREWAERHFASADFRKTAAGVFIQDWMRHAFAAWQARAALDKSTEGASHE